MLAPTTDKAMITIWLTNLSAYTAGRIIDKTLNLPADPEEIDAALKEIGVDCNNTEYFISCYESVYGLDCDEFTNVYELNDFCKELSELNIDQDVLKGLCDYYIDQTEIIDLNFIVWSNCDTMADVAEKMCEEYGTLEGIPEHLKEFFDFEKYGRYIYTSGTFIPYAFGYIEVLN